MVLPGKGMSWKEFLVTLKNEYSRDNLSNVAGSLTYFGLLALFPFLICLVALSTLVIDPAKASELINELSKVAPPEATKLVGDQIRELANKQSGGVFSVALLSALWAASGGVASLMEALNIVYNVEEGRPFWKKRGLAIGITIFTAIFALVAVLIAVATPVVAGKLPSTIGTLLLWLRLPIAGLFMMTLWAVLYWALPDVEQKFKFITPGSIAGVIIWVIASYGFSVYVSNFGKYDATYGALGGIIVTLLWMWISAQVLLLGAEINAVLEHKSPEGKRVGAKSMKDKGGGETKTQLEERTGQRPVGSTEPVDTHPPVRVEPGPPHHHGVKPSLAWLALAFLFGRSRRSA